MQEIFYKKYNEKNLHVTGDRTNSKLKKFISTLSGRWNKKLEPEGWLVNIIHESKLQKYISENTESLNKLPTPATPSTFQPTYI